MMFSLQNVQALASLVLSLLGLFTAALTPWGFGHGRDKQDVEQGPNIPGCCQTSVSHHGWASQTPRRCLAPAWPWPARWHRRHGLCPHTPELSLHIAMSLILSEGRKDLKVKERKSNFFSLYHPCEFGSSWKLCTVYLMQSSSPSFTTLW